MPRPGPRRQAKAVRLSVAEIADVQAIGDREGLADWSEAARLVLRRGILMSQPEPAPANDL
jgi:hypothetical protein